MLPLQAPCLSCACKGWPHQWSSLPHSHPLQELVSKLCASPALAAPTLEAAFENAGSPEAANAVAASLQDCPGSGGKLWLGRLGLNAVNPSGDHSDGSKAAR